MLDLFFLKGKKKMNKCAIRSFGVSLSQYKTPLTEVVRGVLCFVFSIVSFSELLFFELIYYRE